MVSNDLNSIYKQIEKDIQNSLREVAIQIQEDMRLFWLNSIYASKSPMYSYTEELLNSTKISEPKKIGNEWVVEIYIDTSDHTNPAWYNLSELGISVGQKVGLDKIAERMFIIGRSGNIMNEMNERWISNGEALNYVLSRLKSKYDIIA